MIHEEKCYCATCDNCGETYENGMSGFSLFASEDMLSDNLGSSGWYWGHGDHPEHEGKHYCPLCHFEDEEEQLHIKIKEQKDER